MDKSNFFDILLKVGTVLKQSENYYLKHFSSNYLIYFTIIGKLWGVQAVEQSGTALAPIDITVVTILWTLRLATKAKYTATVIAASLLHPFLTHITWFFQTPFYYYSSFIPLSDETQAIAVTKELTFTIIFKNVVKTLSKQLKIGHQLH